MKVELRLVGGLSLFADGQLISGAAAQPRRLAVLAVLAHAWPNAVSRDKLVGLLWPEQDEAGARRLLTQAIYELRRELGEFTRGSGRDIAIDPEAIRIDLVEFRRALQSDEWETAAELYRAPFLDGFYIRNAGEFERWAADAREELHREAQRATERAGAATESRGDLRGALYWAQRRYALAPFDASSVVRVMDLAVRAGDAAAGRKAASEYAERMHAELGALPDPEVARRLREFGESALKTNAAAAPASPVSVTPAIDSPDQVPASERELTPPVRPRATRSARLAIVASVVALGAIMSAAVVSLARRGDAPAARVVHVRVFDARGDTAAARLGDAVRAALVASLDGSGGTRIDTAAASSSWAEVRGAVTSTGGEVRLDAALALGDSSALVRVSAVGARDSLVSLAEQLALELLPALYPELRQAPGIDFARRFRRVAVARRYLDGELALHRGAFGDAYRAFSAATELDSSAAYAWYRRAVAAEDAHQIGDADRSAMLADQLSGTLAPRDRGLIHAYAVWRAGDTHAADSLYRGLLATQPNDAELWYHFAEVSYHGGPMIGHSLDAALDAWRRAAALDSASFPAIMHLLRLEARAGNQEAIQAWMRRVDRIDAGEPLLSEVRAVNAAASAIAHKRDYDARQFDRMPDASAHFVHAVIAGLLERPDLARVPATALVAASRPSATRAEGFIALAHIAVARGQLGLAAEMLDSLAKLQPATAMGWREYFAALPFLSAGTFQAPFGADEDASRGATAAPLYLEVAVDALAAEVVHAYSGALLGGRDTTFECDERDGAARELCSDLERGVRAENALVRGDSSAALALLESLSLRVPYQLAGRSVFYARTRERFRRAQLLERAGRLSESYDWYAATPHAARFDYIYLAPSHLGQGRIRERQGDRAGASEHYRQAIALWQDCDSTVAPLRREAEAGLRRVADP